MHARMFFLWKTDSAWLKSLLRNATALRGSTTSLRGAEVKLNSVGVGYGGRAYRPIVGRSDHWIIQKARPIHQNAPDIANLLCPNSKKYGCQQTCSSTQPYYSFFHGLWLAHCHLWSEDPTHRDSQGGAAACHWAGRRWFSGVWRCSTGVEAQRGGMRAGQGRRGAGRKAG